CATTFIGVRRRASITMKWWPPGLTPKPSRHTKPPPIRCNSAMRPHRADGSGASTFTTNDFTSRFEHDRRSGELITSRPPRDRSGFVVFVLPPGHHGAETIGAREALWRQPPGIGAITAPVGVLLAGQRELAPGRVGPGQAGLGLESLQVGQAAILEALQPHT